MSFKYEAAVNVKKCVKQIKLHNSLHVCTPYSVQPFYVSGITNAAAAYWVTFMQPGLNEWLKCS